MCKFINTQNLDDVLQLGEGQYIEFKESFDKSFAKEIVAFANASGGIIYFGITDSNVIKVNYFFPKKILVKEAKQETDCSLICYQELNIWKKPELVFKE